MNPNFDLTGIGIIVNLRPSTHYEYQIGHYFTDGELTEARLNPATVDWSSASDGSFRTASRSSRADRTIVVGSCRYLLKTFLGDFFDDRGDKTFRTILRQIRDDGTEIDQLLMIGDQIYADDLNVFNPDKTVDQFYRRYRDAFSQKYVRRLMAHVPTYMTLDDHEIEDNWPEEASEKDFRTLFPVAMHAYQAYQLSHSPAIGIRGRRMVGTPKKLWYDYSDGCCDVFVTDSRTERVLDPTHREMLGPAQMRALKRWLANGSGRAKLIVTSVPFIPDSSGRSEGGDKWAGFPAQRTELLEHIERRGLKKVVFLSGDVHASMSLEAESPSGARVISVVSSAFFWPYPHPSPRKFSLRGRIDGGRAGIFTLQNASRIVSDDNFTRLEVSTSGIEVSVFGRKGRLLSRHSHSF